MQKSVKGTALHAALLSAVLSAALLGAATPAGARVITAAVPTGFSTLDSWDAIDNLSRTVARSMYEGLYVFDKDLKPTPQLAESYEVSKAASSTPSSCAAA